MTLENRIVNHLKLLENNLNSREEVALIIRDEFFNFLYSLKQRQLRSLSKFKDSFEESNGFIPESLDFKSVYDLITYFEIREFNLIDNQDKSQKTLLEVTK